MWRLHQLSILVAAVMGLAACSGGDEPPTESTEATTVAQNQTPPPSKAEPYPFKSDYQRPDYYPPPNPFAKVGNQTLDTLRVLKKQHGITRDQYWEKQGGVLGNDFFEVWYPPGPVTVTHGMHAMNLLMGAHAKFQEYFSDSPAERLVIYTCADLEEFKKKTGRDFWFHSEVRGDSMIMQPVWLFFRRTIDEEAIPHEYYQWAVGKITSYGAPRWLEEGIAGFLADEGKILEEQTHEFPMRPASMPPEELEKALEREDAKRESRLSYYYSYMMVATLVDQYGEDRLKAAVKNLAQGQVVEEALANAYETTYEKVIRTALSYADGL